MYNHTEKCIKILCKKPLTESVSCGILNTVKKGRCYTMMTYTEYNRINRAWFDVDDMISKAHKVAMTGHRNIKNVTNYDNIFKEAMYRLAKENGFYFTDKEWEEEVIDF